jgi:hypothetical protein
MVSDRRRSFIRHCFFRGQLEHSEFLGMRLIFGHYKVESIRFPESVFVFKFPSSRDHHDFSSKLIVIIASRRNRFGETTASVPAGAAASVPASPIRLVSAAFTGIGIMIKSLPCSTGRLRYGQPLTRWADFKIWTISAACAAALSVTESVPLPLLAEKNGRGSRSVLREMSECYYW